jgi:cell division septation protein DedD
MSDDQDQSKNVNKDDWVVIFVAENLIQAKLIQAQLEDEGIPTYVPDDFPSPHAINRTQDGPSRENAQKAGALIQEHF